MGIPRALRGSSNPGTAWKAISQGSLNLQADDAEDDDEDVEGEDVGNSEREAQNH